MGISIIRAAADLTKSKGRFVSARFFSPSDKDYKALPEQVKEVFDASYLSTEWVYESETKKQLYIGIGDVLDERLKTKELAAKAFKTAKEDKYTDIILDMDALIKAFAECEDVLQAGGLSNDDSKPAGNLSKDTLSKESLSNDSLPTDSLTNDSPLGLTALSDVIEGLYLAAYEQRLFKGNSGVIQDSSTMQDSDTKQNSNKSDKKSFTVCLTGIPEAAGKEADDLIRTQLAICEGISFARDMVNLPGNHLRPVDFANNIRDFVVPVGVTTEIYDAEALKKMGMEALLGIGESSEYPPCFVVMKYMGDPDSDEISGIVGKGVTVDTGGYCLKPANSMLGIKGDMAGGAAVSGAIYALAKNKVKKNVKAFIPMCENRISPGSLLPGDVISSYSGKTIEVQNTDAEGRLILADAVSYAVKNEQVTEVLDIATLTGAVVGMYGFSIAGVVCDNDALYQRFATAYDRSGERYARIPFYREHEKMIESDIADIKNLSSGGCGTITAGLFIRAFAGGLPWIHLDIAGTAWTDPAVFEFQNKGATGAGTSSIYYLVSNH